MAARFRSWLTRKDQEMLIRYYRDNHSPEEICRDLGISHGEFQTRKRRARALLTEGMRLQ